MYGFYAGQADMGVNTLVLAPANAGFFALALAMLQDIIAYDDIPADFEPKATIFIAPPFRHTHFDGKQVVVHNRRGDRHEMFAYNLYPGPSAKKGVYGILIALGEREGWVTAHCSTVQVVTPYDNVVTIDLPDAQDADMDRTQSKTSCPSGVYSVYPVNSGAPLTMPGKNGYNVHMGCKPMETLTVTISETLYREIEPYRDELAELLRLGLRQVKMEQALAMYRQGGISLWRAARIGSVSLREMTQYAAAQGLRATADEETIREELA